MKETAIESLQDDHLDNESHAKTSEKDEICQETPDLHKQKNIKMRKANKHRKLNRTRT